MIDINERFSEKKNFFNRLIFVYIFFACLFLYLIYKTFSLQVSSFTDYEIASLKNKTREVLIQPRRGIIYDRNGEIIVNNVPSYNLIINPSAIDDLDSTLSDIKKIIDLGCWSKKIIFKKQEKILNVYGAHNLKNCGAAIAAAKTIGLSEEKCINALESFKGVKINANKKPTIIAVIITSKSVN